MSNDPDEPEDADALPPTALADLAKRAKERVGPEPDRVTPAATRTMAAIVRDLKGLPDVLVSREGTHKIKIARRGKVGAIQIEYQPNIRVIEVNRVGMPGADPTTIKMRRYAVDLSTETVGNWQRLEGGGELIADIREGVLLIYPELAD